MVSPDPDLFPPELEELVAEIARDPRSCLLRVERPRRPAALYEAPDPLSPRTAGLTAAEREILTVHREELSSLLLQRWLTEVTLRPTKGSLIFDGSASKDRSSLEVGYPSLHELVEQGRQQLPDVDLAEALLDPSEALTSEQCSRLVTWAVRLSPDTRTRIYLAGDHNRTGQCRTAISLIRRLLAIEWRPGLRPYLWGILATAHGEDWSPSDRVRWYRRAAQIPEVGVEQLLVWLLVATNAGELASAREAASIIDDRIVLEDPRVERHVEAQIRTRREGRWHPNARRRRDLDALLEVVGPTSRKVLRALEP